MNIFGIGLPEMVVIFVLALLIFGPKKLPEIGRSLGKTLKSFQEASKEFEAEIKKGATIDSPPESSSPVQTAPASLAASTAPIVAPIVEEVEKPQTTIVDIAEVAADVAEVANELVPESAGINLSQKS